MTDLSSLPVPPDPDFVDHLERLLLADLSWTDEFVAPVSRSRFAGGRPEAPSRRPRRVVTVASAVLLAAAVVTLGLLVTRDDERPPAGSLPATTTPTTTALIASTTTLPTSTSTSTTTTTIDVNAGPAPFGALEARTYEVRDFVVPFTFTVPAGWSRNQSSRQLLQLERGTDARIAVTEGIVQGSTPLEALANVCAGKLEATTPAQVTLLGTTGQRIETRATADCMFVLCTTVSLSGCRVVFGAGDVVQLTAAKVGDLLIVVIAGGTAESWNDIGPEVDGIIASLEPLG